MVVFRTLVGLAGTGMVELLRIRIDLPAWGLVGCTSSVVPFSQDGAEQVTHLDLPATGKCGMSRAGFLTAPGELSAPLCLAEEAEDEVGVLGDLDLELTAVAEEDLLHCHAELLERPAGLNRQVGTDTGEPSPHLPSVCTTATRRIFRFLVEPEDQVEHGDDGVLDVFLELLEAVGFHGVSNAGDEEIQLRLHPEGGVDSG